MSTPTPATTWQSERARIAGMSSRPNRLPDDPELVDARRNLRALRLEEHVQKILAQAPPLNDEQRNRIAALLRVGGGVRQRDHDGVEDAVTPDLNDLPIDLAETAS